MTEFVSAAAAPRHGPGGGAFATLGSLSALLSTQSFPVVVSSRFRLLATSCTHLCHGAAVYGCCIWPPVTMAHATLYSFAVQMLNCKHV